MRFNTYLLVLISLCGPIFSSDLVQEDANLENLIQQSVSQGYHEDFIDLVEMIYGKGFLSQGGEASIERMLTNVAIDNRKILDIGSGLGGPVLHLAGYHPIDITGLEPQKWLFERAVQNLNEKKKESQRICPVRSHGSSRSFESICRCVI
jgi:tRNA G46 methylase TrmB